MKHLVIRLVPIRFATALKTVLAVLALQLPAASADGRNAAELFIELLIGESFNRVDTIQTIEQTWTPSMVPMMLETIRFANNGPTRNRLIRILEENTGQSFGTDLDSWFRWQWAQPEQRHPNYASFKSMLYLNLDPKFEHYFNDNRKSDIRLDEIRWGGVRQDGIPPLRSPKMISAGDAQYLSDSDIVFGISINGDTRAYPKRILAWHEMFTDQIAGIDFAGVYCTLCGAVILYQTEHAGIRHELGTSGFLFRSNKVMYDRQTQSLWSTTLGKPVVGPLVDQGIQLERSFLVTSTWGEWRRRHPDTSVLSLRTGYQRNYDEGAAYKSYFATDELMFSVPKTDNRLANKDEILALWYPESSNSTVAISTRFLSGNPVYHHRVGPKNIVVLTDPSGASRVYDADNLTFTRFDGAYTATDSSDQQWTLTEAQLTSPTGRILRRLPAHRSFWFGWYATFNDTELVTARIN